LLGYNIQVTLTGCFLKGVVEMKAGISRIRMLPLLIVVLMGVSFLAPSTALSVPSSQALFTEQNLGGGLWKYDYTVLNTSDPTADPGFDIYDFTLNFSPAVTLTDIIFPTDWDYITDSASFINWFSLMAGVPPTGSDIAPGASLGGFIFTSNTPLAALLFDVTLTDPTNSGNPYVFSGETSPAPTPIPEPSTIVLLLAGCMGLYCLRKKAEL
jgi:hypothetical protein